MKEHTCREKNMKRKGKERARESFKDDVVGGKREGRG